MLQVFYSDAKLNIALSGPVICAHTAGAVFHNSSQVSPLAKNTACVVWCDTVCGG